MHLDDQVDVSEERGLIVIDPVLTRNYDLAELLAGITEENLRLKSCLRRVRGL